MTSVTRRRFPLWMLLGAVLVVALVVGSGVFRSGAPTPAQRAYAIESVVRCPSCEDLSVADSTAQTAVTVRATVVRQLAQGRTNQQIEDYLAARYGSAIVLDPSTSTARKPHHRSPAPTRTSSADWRSSAANAATGSRIRALQ